MKPVRVLVLFLLGILLILPFTVTAERDQTTGVTIVYPDETKSIRTDGKTVGSVLEDRNVKLDDYDHVFPSPESEIVSGLKIFLYRSRSNQRTSEPSSSSFRRSQPRTIYSNAIPKGREMIVRGKKRIERHGSRILPRVVLRGGPHYKAERVDELVEKGSMAMLATGYSPHAASTAPFNDGKSALGLPAGYGLAAVDPQVIPLGTRLYVDGYGYAIAADVGGGIDGRQIDLCFNTHKNALRFGRQWIKVHILG